MPVIPQFQPAAGPGQISAAMRSGVQTGMSMAERSQIARMREEQIKQAQQKNAEDLILAPVRAAKAKADLITIDSQLEGMKRAEETRGMAASMLPHARREFDEIMLTPVIEDREQLATEWIGRYGQLAGVQEYADEFKSKKELAATAITESRTIREMQRKTAEEKELIKERGAAQVAVANARSAAPSKSEFLSLMSQLDRAKADGDEEAINFTRGRLDKLSNIPPARMQKVEALLELKRDAEAVGDEEAAQIYAKALEKETHVTEGDPFKKALADELTKGKAPAPAPAPTPAPEQAPSPSPAPVSDAGKPYKVIDGMVSFESAKTPQAFLKAMQQAVDDGVVDPDEARAALRQRGFTSKK